MSHEQERDLLARLDRLEAACSEIRQSQEDLRARLRNLGEAMRDIVHGGIETLDRLARLERRLGMDP